MCSCQTGTCGFVQAMGLVAMGRDNVDVGQTFDRRKVEQTGRQRQGAALVLDTPDRIGYVIKATHTTLKRAPGLSQLSQGFSSLTHWQCVPTPVVKYSRGFKVYALASIVL